jgi:hypothetical protein
VRLLWHEKDNRRAKNESVVAEKICRENKPTNPKGTMKNAELRVKELGTQIVVLERGFVYVGKVKVDGDWVTIENARNIRRWGTTKGLGELAGGPTKETKLDEAGTVQAPMRSVIQFVQCTRDW